FTRLGLHGHDAYTASWINMVVGTVGLWGAVCLVPPQETLHARGLLFFILAGLIGTVGGRLFRSVGIEKVGASVAAAITNLNPFISTGLAIVLLGERVTLPHSGGNVDYCAGHYSALGQRQARGISPSPPCLSLSLGHVLWGSGNPKKARPESDGSAPWL